MSPRPRAVTIIGWLFIATGAMGFVAHAPELVERSAVYESIWILFVRLLAVAGGIFLLRGANWARWLLVAWLAWHVALSVWHDVASLVVHTCFLVVIGYFLFRPQISGYFRR